jgi:hypothetical protein
LIKGEDRLEEGLQALFDIQLNGYRKRNTEEGTPSESPLTEVTDSSGVTTRLRGIHFNDRPHVAGRLGDAEIQLDPGKLESITFVADDGRFLGTIQTKDGKVSGLVFDREIEVSGDTSFGKFKIPIGKLNGIHFSPDDKEQKR